MTHDWHAAYLTCPTVADAARRRCAQTGEDGWSAAATLARTMPPGFGHHEAAGARAVIAPDTEPSEDEERRLKHVARMVMSEPLDPASVEEWEAQRDLACVTPRAPFLRIQYATLGAFAEARRDSVGPFQLNTCNTQRAVVPPDIPSYTCPHCFAVSHDPSDAEHGYCGRCHDWTGALHSLTEFRAAVDRRWETLGVDPAGEPVSIVFIHDEPSSVSGEQPPPERDTLRGLLERIRAGELTLDEANAHPAIHEGRRRRLITEPSPALSGRRRRGATQGATARAHLTELGRVELRRLQQAARDQDNQIRIDPDGRWARLDPETFRTGGQVNER